MTLTLSSWILPTIATVVFFVIMFRPYRSSGQFDFGAIFRLFWLIPILVTWVIYFGVLVAIK